MKQVTILGCSRSGTLFVSLLYKAIGVDVGHEKARKEGMVGWPTVLPVHLEQYPEAERLLLVRNPLNVVVSTLTHRKIMWENLATHIGKLPKTPLLRSMEYWTRWNNMCKPLCTGVVHVESLGPGSEEWKMLLRAVGKAQDTPFPANIRTNTNTRSHPKHNIRAWESKWPSYVSRLRKAAKLYDYEI